MKRPIRRKRVALKFTKIEQVQKVNDHFFPSKSKKFFRAENIQFSSRRLFLCPEIAHYGQSSQVCRVVGVLYIACDGDHRSWEAGSDVFKLRYWPYFLRIFRYSSTRA